MTDRGRIQEDMKIRDLIIILGFGIAGIVLVALWALLGVLAGSTSA